MIIATVNIVIFVTPILHRRHSDHLTRGFARHASLLHSSPDFHRLPAPKLSTGSAFPPAPGRVRIGQNLRLVAFKPLMPLPLELATKGDPLYPVIGIAEDKLGTRWVAANCRR